jgi:atypical dual specificity phosphatase
MKAPAVGAWPAVRSALVGTKDMVWGLERFLKLTPRNIPILGLVGFAISYLLCQRHMLPLPVSAVVSKMAFLPTFPITAFSRRGNYWTEIDDTVVLGCAPFDFAVGHPKKLHALGVRGVVNMCAEYTGPVDTYANLGIRQLRLPTTDHFESSVEQLEDAVAFIDQHRQRGERVYVHCKAGHGRAAAVVLSDMIKLNPHMPPITLNAALFGRRKVRKTLYKQSNVLRFIERLGASDEKWNTVSKKSQ